ncbi:MAG: 4-phosphoerythronate dehydrogenase [Phycisphaerae bacterium]|nr:4-phosphoerythronate dehydrogenase [Phycisphaerae bacterium]MDD5380873.1 4-phosphoerythronate dehydrogenase [Phycisphaerae bacterium]
MKIIADANIPFVKDCFSSVGEVEVFPGREITRDVVGEAECLLVRSVTKVDSNLLAGSRVRFVGTATIGFDHIDIGNLSRNNIGFASAPGSNANSAAEYVIAGLFEIERKYKIKLEGKSIGIIGVGNVGSKVAEKCASLGMKILLNDPPLQRASGDVKYRPLEELYDCDFITLHTPLTFEGADKTFHLAGEKFFKSLKAGCVFINASRGEVADGKAMKASMRSGELETVVLDVWENEPNIDTELLEMIDIGTPHIAGYSLDGKITGMIMIYKAACEYFGLKAERDIEEFLPEPDVPQLKINPGSGSDQDAIRKAIEKIYKISEDDGKLRKILNVQAKRGEFFDNLRKSYRVRREFQNTEIITAENTENLRKKLEGIGFKVKSGK